MNRAVRLQLFVAYLLASGCAIGNIGEVGQSGAGVRPAPGTGGHGSCPDETCDGFDNDCDGLVDEDCPCEAGAEQACYSGPPVTVDIGQCRSGIQSCQGGSWGPCNGEVPPSEELCDGFDNDCDSAVDQSCQCNDGEEQTCYTGSPVTVDIGECHGGMQSCVGNAWGPCQGDQTPVDEECDDLDHDCDGVNSVDNHVVDLGTMSDAAADQVTVTGHSSPAGHSRWWTFEAADDTDSSGDEFHVDIRFLENPGNAYVLDIYRGSCTAGDLDAIGEDEAYDWYTDFDRTSSGCTLTPPCGEGDCAPSPAPAGVNTCTDDTVQYLVRVVRVDGQPSLDEFTLEISNGVYH